MASHSRRERAIDATLTLVDDEIDLHIDVYPDAGQRREVGECGLARCASTDIYPPGRWLIESRTASFSFVHDRVEATKCGEVQPTSTAAVATDTPWCAKHLVVVLAATLGLDVPR